MNAQEREAFWKNLCALPGLDLSQDAKQLMAAIRFPKLLFRYRPVNLNSLEALRTIGLADQSLIATQDICLTEALERFSAGMNSVKWNCPSPLLTNNAAL